MADYLVLMFGEMPDIDVGYVVSPTSATASGAKDAGEAGTAGPRILADFCSVSPVFGDRMRREIQNRHSAIF